MSNYFEERRKQILLASDQFPTPAGQQLIELSLQLNQAFWDFSNAISTIMLHDNSPD
ncbi:MAG TPA: hypothetical protein V6D29_13670 [Leptolyngbyaceae cyanobacterium]